MPPQQQQQTDLKKSVQDTINTAPINHGTAQNFSEEIAKIW